MQPQYTNLDPLNPREIIATGNNSLTIDDYYNPRVAQQQQGVGQIVGTPGSDCYGLRTEPFNECANLLAVLQYDQDIVLQYSNILLPILRDDRINSQVEGVQGIVRAIHTRANLASIAARKFIISVISQVRGQAHWEDPQGNVYDSTHPLYYDANVSRDGWRFVLDYQDSSPQEGEYLLYSNFITGLDNLNSLNIPYKVGFDFTGELYRGSSFNQEEKTFDISREVNGVVNDWAKEWPYTVAFAGPDAVRRGVIAEDDQNYYAEASFYNLCLTARGKLAEYKDQYPTEYENDLQNLTPQQVSSLNLPPASPSSSDSLPFAEEAEKEMASALYYATEPNFYSSYNGILNNEALYRVAICIQSLRNIIVVCKESIKGLDLSRSYFGRQVTLQQNEEEYQQKLEEERRRKSKREAALAERFDPNSCRIVEEPIPNPCADKKNPTKTFLENWIVRDRTSPFYSIDDKCYYLVYDTIVEDLADFTANRDRYLNTYGTEVYKILNEKFSLDLPDVSTISYTIGGIKELINTRFLISGIERPIAGGAFTITTPIEILEPVVRIAEDGIYYEPRAFKASKFLFRLEDNVISTLRLKEAALKPRYIPQNPDGPYVRTYYFSIKDFFDALEGFENILKKYVFDHALWKNTFGSQNPSVTNMSVVSNPFFKNIKTNILQQDLKTFRKFRDLFSNLLSKNGIMLADDRRIMKTGQTSAEDRISLTFVFESEQELVTFDGTNIVRPPSINSLTQPPTNNAGTGVISGLLVGKNIRLYRVQISDSSRPPVDMIWKGDSGSGSNLSGLNSQDAFKQETAMNYLLNLDTLLNVIRPNKKERV